MKVLTCASYRNTGSTAVTDLFSEYDMVHSLTNYEFRFLHDTDGVTDLEYNLVDHHDRDNSYHAVKRFLRLSKFNAGTWFNKRYEPFFNNQYWYLTVKYIEELTDVKYKGHDFYDYYDRGSNFYYYRKRLEDRVIRKLTNRKYGVFNNEEIYCAFPTEQRFLECTRIYVEQLLKVANRPGKPYIVVDQIVPSTNISQCLRYFDDISVIVVDRDPRDLYAIAAYFNDRFTPHHSPEQFCKWFLYSRHEKPERSNHPRIKRIMFEDLIYNYHNTVKDLEFVTGLSPLDHTRQFQALNPKKSVYNTMVFNRYTKRADIEYIEKHLSNYLYDFSNCTRERVCGVDVKNPGIFDR